MKTVLSTLNAKYIHTNLAIRCLKAYCADEFEVELAEYTIKDPAMNIITDLYRRKPDVVGFSCYIWNIEQTVDIVRMLRKVLPEVTILLGGPEVSFDTDEWMKRVPEVDFIIMGEGEATFLHLLRELDGGRSFPSVLGAAYREGERIVLNPPRPALDLSSLPSPHRFPEDVPQIPERIVYFETSRGCPFNCQFCLSSLETGVRYFDLERAKQDLLYLIESGAKQIKFMDRTFNIKKDYAMEIFRFLIDNHRGCVFQFEITADIMWPDVLEYLAEHAPPGIFRFEIGVQSTNELTNDLVKRRQNFGKLTRTVHMIKDSGKIDQHLDLIAGLPEEDYASFRQTFNDVFAMEPEELQLGFLKMLRGTGMRKDADKYGYAYMDNAPYEILGNDRLPFDDIIRIKRAEDILEKYWNAHRMDHTVKYLLHREFPTPFDFFQQFGDFWEDNGWQRIGHQLEDLFIRLAAFVQSIPSIAPASQRIIEDLMKLDYYAGHKFKPRRVWWEHPMRKEEQARSMRLAAEQPETVSGNFAARGIGEKELLKLAVVERLCFDLGTFLATGDIRGNQPSLLIAYYDQDVNSRAQIYALPESDAGQREQPGPDGC